jgi:hypothetical protein
MSSDLPAQQERVAQARLEALVRDDKWYLSVGDGALWAPPFPRHLHRPGFWDPAHLLDYETPPLFSVALVDENGRSDPLEAHGSDWRPDRLRTRWRSRSGLLFSEYRYLLPGGRFCSAWRTEEELGWPNPAFQNLTLLAFTAVPSGHIRGIRADDPGIRWTMKLRSPTGEILKVDTHLAVDLLPPRGRHSTARRVLDRLARARLQVFRGALRSEGPAYANWDLGPFVECWMDCEGGRLEEMTPPEAGSGGHTHLVTALPLREIPVRYGIAFISTLVPVDPHAPPRARAQPAAPPMPRRAAARWREMLATFPRFDCSDPYLAKAFDYHLYGLYLNRIEGGRGPLPRPAIAAGIASHHVPRARSTCGHVRESRWCSDPATAYGSLLNFLDAQREDGSLPGRLPVSRQDDGGFEHANWGDAFMAVEHLHPRDDVLSVAYGCLSRYADWLKRERDPERCGLFTVRGPEEIAQECSPRFGRTDPPLTRASPTCRKGVDATVYAYQLFQTLTVMALRLERVDEAASWRATAEHTGTAMLTDMWAPELGLFTDFDLDTGTRTDVKSVVGFYPLLTDLPEDEQVAGLLLNLSDPASFATPFPVPSCSVDDPAYSPAGVWDGERRGAPWNGRVSPTANCTVAEGLLRHWHRGRAEVGISAAALLARSVRMMSLRQDPARPSSFEHYNPVTGHPSLFRGTDDHRHAWILDLLIRGVTGAQPTKDALVIHPLPLYLDRAVLQGHLRGHDLEVVVDCDKVEVTLDGESHRTSVGTPLTLPW